MVLPQNAVKMQAEEMRYLEGGVSLKVKKAYLKKSTCTSLGKKYSKRVGLSSSRIAKEIYAHAVLYYASTAEMIAAAITVPYVAQPAVIAGCIWIRSHANPIDIGGDSATRVKIYNAIWKAL